jgi:hypothetical protein
MEALPMREKRPAAASRLERVACLLCVDEGGAR